MDVTATKVIVLFLLGIIKLLSGIAPLFLTKILKRKSDRFLKKFIGTVLCFGGGVLLGTVFMHMLKEVRESMEGAVSMGFLPEIAEYPFSELLICLGFLMILLIESAVHKFFGGHNHSHFPSQDTLARKVADVETPIRGIDNRGYDSTEAKESYTSTHSTNSSEVDNKQDGNSILSNLRSFLVVVALSVHSLFEGMAVGLEESNSGVWKLMMAISIHAVPIVFCVGTDMISSGVKKIKIIIYIIFLSINTPLGILIGVIVTIHVEEASAQHIFLIGVLQGLAAGTLLYITFFEVLSRDKLTKYGMSGLVGALAVVLGFSLMAGLEAGAGHSHSHGGHDHGHDLGHHEPHGLHEDYSGLHDHHDHEDHDHEDHIGHFHGYEDDHDHEHHDEKEHGWQDHDHEHYGHEGEDHDHVEEDHNHNHEGEDHDHDHDHEGEDHDHDHEGENNEHDHEGEDHEHDQDGEVHEHDHEGEDHDHEGEDHEHEGEDLDHEGEDHDHA